MAMDAAGAATLLKDLPMISSPITSAGWRAHLKRLNLFFHIKQVADVAGNNALKRTLLFYFLGNDGGVKAYHLSPDQRDPNETYAVYLAELGKVFVPPQESDMARSDYRKCKQQKNEPLQTFHNKKTRLWYDAYQITPANIASHMDSFLEEYLSSIVRKEVKLDLIENKPYDRPEDVLTRALSSAAKHRMLIADGAPASAYDGLHSTNQSVIAPTPPSTGARAAAAAAAGEPMEIGMLEQDEQQWFCGLQEEESLGETNFWENPECQLFNALDQSGKQTALCWECHKPGHQKRDCWRRPRNQALMRSRGGASGASRGAFGRQGNPRGRWQRNSGGRGSPSAAYRRTVEIAQQAGRGGPHGGMRPPGRFTSSYINALHSMHDDEQPLYMLEADDPGNQPEEQQGDSSSLTPAAAAATGSQSNLTIVNRPSFNANF